MRDRSTPPVQPTRLLVMVAALAVATTIAACGSSSRTTSGGPTAPSASNASSSSSGGSATSTNSTLTFSRCMRSNGVPNFPDLGSKGMLLQANGQTVSINGVSVNAPAYRGARSKCQRYLPTHTATPAQQAQEIARGLQFARCMRSHGVPNFPDPKSRPGVDGNSVAYLPGVDPLSPAFQAGAKVCGGFAPKGPL